MTKESTTRAAKRQTQAASEQEIAEALAHYRRRNANALLPEDAAPAPKPPSSDDMLDKIISTLQENLENIAPRHQREAIHAAVRSAYKLGIAHALRDANSKEDAAEDRALDRSPDAGVDLEGIGHEFIMGFVRHFGSLAHIAGLRTHDLSFRWMKFRTEEGGEVIGLIPSVPAHVAARFPKH